MNTFAERRWLPFMVEIIGGAIAGIIVAVPLVFLAGALIAPRPGSFDDVVGSLAGLYIGYVIGVATGVILVGRIMKHHGVWWAALAGSVGGAVIVIIFANVGGANLPNVVSILYITLVPILSALVFAWSAARGS
jgi:hypothetical protein